MYKANFVHCRDPFRPRVGAVVEPINRRTRVDTILRQKGFITGKNGRYERLKPFIVCIGSVALTEDQWGRVIQHGDTVTLLARPRGGGGGGSNPLNSLMTIAMAVASVYTGGLALAAWGAVAGAAVGVGVTVVGSLLINAVLPISNANTLTAASPSYGISAQGNAARLGEAIPRVYGRYNVYPDYASKPYTENSGNQQMLYQLFLLSQGQVEIEKIRIGDTDIASFGADLQYEVIQPNGAVTLFPDNVDTSTDVSNLEAKASNEKQDSDPDNWTNVLGPFVANPPATLANAIGIDVTLPGLSKSDSKGGIESIGVIWTVEAQAINDGGVATGGWFTLGTTGVTMATADTQLLSYKYAVTPGRYQVRFTRTDGKDTSNGANNTVYWSGLKAYLPSTRVYGNVTLLAMVITATNNLNSTNAKQLNVTMTGKVPVWNGTSWSDPVASRSIAWAITDMCRNTDYGAGLTDDRLNLAGLLALDAVWAARGETLDGTFDSTQTFWDALTQACYVGRAVPIYYAGVIDIVRDDVKTIRTAVFTPGNMVSDSWSTQYTYPGKGAVDCVDVTYTDPDSWQKLTVRCALSDSAQLNPKAVTLALCTSRTQAYALGMYMCACNRDQRKFISFKTEMDGYIPKYGDLVTVSHDAAGWGQSGAVDGDSWNAGTGYLRTSEPLEWTEGVQHYIRFRALDGSEVGPYYANRGGEDNEVIVAATAAQLEDLFISNGYDYDPTIYTFGPSIETMSLDCIMLSAEPADDDTVELTMVNYAASVYQAESDSSAPVPPASSQLVSSPLSPVMSGISVTMTQTAGQVSIVGPSAVGASTYEFGASADNGNSWQFLGASPSPLLIAQLSVGAWKIRARAVGALAGPYVYWSGSVYTLLYAPGGPTLTLSAPFTGTSLAVNISDADTATYFTVDVMTGGVVRHTFTTSIRQFTWSITDATNAGGVSPAITFAVTAGNAAGESAASYLTVTNPAPSAPVMTLSTDLTRLTISGNGEPDLSTAYIKAGDGDYESGPVPYTIASLPVTTFTAYVTDVWGNQSPTSTFTTPDNSDPGGGGGGG